MKVGADRSSISRIRHAMPGALTPGEVSEGFDPLLE
jgi:hypothetical protein